MAEQIDPNKLIRKQAGAYGTADDRFEVRRDGGRWFLVDTQRTDELGQGLIQGPFATLNAVREIVSEARRTPLKSVPRPTPARGSGRAKRKPAPPPSWIDRLPGAEARAVRALIRALEQQGLADAESLVRRDHEGLGPEVVTRLLERRLEALVEEFPEQNRAAIRALVQRVSAIFTAEGHYRPADLPGWTLVEIGPEAEPRNRRIRLDD
ncbi:hypothetical protein BH24CHL6_BH24CHL6_09410 [soil metagenome]